MINFSSIILPALLASSQANVAIPKTNPSSWITPKDYPPALIVEKANGTVDFRLAVGPSGRPVGCVVIAGTGWKDLDSYTCNILLKKAVFQPWKATKDDSKPRFYRSKVFWRLPVPKLVTT